MLLLNKMTFTEQRYNQYYVDNRCCLIALINSILFYLFGSRGYFLGNAAGPISIQQEQAAIRWYNNARNRLLLETDEKTIVAFSKAFQDRVKQLLVLDSTLTYFDLEKACESDMQDEEVFKKFLSARVEQLQLKLEEVITLFTTDRNPEQEKLNEAIKRYIEALPPDSLYKRLDQDVFRMCLESNKKIPGPVSEAEKDKRFLKYSDCIALKQAIVKQLFLEESENRDALFLNIYSSDIQHVVCGCDWSVFYEHENLVEQIMRNIAGFIRASEDVYREWGTRLKQTEGDAASDRLRLCGLITSYIFQYIDDNHKLLEQNTSLSEEQKKEVDYLLNVTSLFTSSEENRPSSLTLNHIVFCILDMAQR